MADHCIGFVLGRSDRSFKAIPILVHTTELRELDVALRLPEGKARSPQASPRAEGGGGVGDSWDLNTIP